MDTIFELFEKGTINCPVDRIYSLHDYEAAIKRAQIATAWAKSYSHTINHEC